MKTFYNFFSILIYLLSGFIEPAIYDIGSTDNKLGILDKIVNFISTLVVVFTLIWGLITIREIVNYLEFVRFLIIFCIIGLFVSIFIVFIIAILIPSLKGNKTFLFSTLFSFTLLTPLLADYLNKNVIDVNEKNSIYELINKKTKSKEAMFCWVYLKKSNTEIKINVPKEVFNSLKLNDKVEVRMKIGLLNLEFIDFVHRIDKNISD